MGVEVELLKQANALASDSPVLAELLRRAALELRWTGPLDYAISPERAPLFSAEEPAVRRGPTIRPDCCADGHANIFLAMETVDGRPVPSHPEAWYLGFGMPPMATTYDGKPIESAGGFMSLLIRYCPYCGAKLDPGRDD